MNMHLNVDFQMNRLDATAYTAALLAALLLIAAVRVINARKAHGIALGDGGSLAIQTAGRAFSNLTEYAPTFLLLLLIAELRGARPEYCLILGLLFLLGRAVHLFTFSAEPTIGRMFGMILTFGGLIGSVALMLGASGGIVQI